MSPAGTPMICSQARFQWVTTWSASITNAGTGLLSMILARVSSALASSAVEARPGRAIALKVMTSGALLSASLSAWPAAGRRTSKRCQWPLACRRRSVKPGRPRAVLAASRSNRSASWVRSSAWTRSSQASGVAGSCSGVVPSNWWKLAETCRRCSSACHSQQPTPARASASSRAVAGSGLANDMVGTTGELEQLDVVALVLHLGHELVHRFMDRHALHDGVEHGNFFAGRVLGLDLVLQADPFAGVVQPAAVGNPVAEVAQAEPDVGQALDQLVVELAGDDGLMDHAGNVLGDAAQVLLGDADFALIGQGVHGIGDHPHVAGHGREGVSQDFHRGVAVLHRGFDLHRGKFEHQHRLADLAPVEVRHVGGGAARLAGFVTHY